MEKNNHSAKPLIQLGTYLYFIDNTNDFQGILETGIIKRFEKFLFLVRLRKFKKRIDDNQLISFAYSECFNNPYNKQLIEKIDNYIVCETFYDYRKSESFIRDFKDKVKQINNDLYSLEFENNIFCTLSRDQLNSFYKNINSFYLNYLILVSMYSIISIGIPKQDDIIVTTDVPDKKIVTEDKDKLELVDHVLSLCLNGIVRYTIIDWLFKNISYIEYFKLPIEKIDDNNQIQNFDQKKIILEINQLFCDGYIGNLRFIKELIISFEDINESKLIFYINRIINAIIENKVNIRNDKISLFLMIELLFLYFLIFIYKTHTTNFLTNFENWMLDISIQTKIFNTYIDSISKKSHLLEIKTIKLEEKNIENQSQDEIEEKYGYLRDIDQYEFLDMIFLHNTNKKQEKNISELKINRKTIIDLNKIFSKDDIKLEFGNIQFNLLQYQKNNKDNVITDAFRLIIEYSKDHSIILNDSLFDRFGIPKSVTKLFDSIQKLLNQKTFKKENVSTFMFYKILMNNIPELSELDNSITIFIIYQIIIPYYYKTYKITKFIDCFI